MSILYDVINDVFACAEELTGCHAPYEMEPEREFYAKARVAVAQALNHLPSAVTLTLERKLQRLTDQRDKAIAEGERAYNEESEL